MAFLFYCSNTAAGRTANRGATQAPSALRRCGWGGGESLRLHQHQLPRANNVTPPLDGGGIKGESESLRTHKRQLPRSVPLPLDGGGIKGEGESPSTHHHQPQRTTKPISKQQSTILTQRLAAPPRNHLSAPTLPINAISARKLPLTRYPVAKRRSSPRKDSL